MPSISYFSWRTSLLVTCYVLKLLQALFQTLILVLTRIFYRLQIRGIENIPLKAAL